MSFSWLQSCKQPHLKLLSSKCSKRNHTLALIWNYVPSKSCSLVWIPCFDIGWDDQPACHSDSIDFLFGSLLILYFLLDPTDRCSGCSPESWSAHGFFPPGTFLDTVASCCSPGEAPSLFDCVKCSEMPSGVIWPFDWLIRLRVQSPGQWPFRVESACSLCGLLSGFLHLLPQSKNKWWNGNLNLAVGASEWVWSVACLSIWPHNQLITAPPPPRDSWDWFQFSQDCLNITSHFNLITEMKMEKKKSAPFNLTPWKCGIIFICIIIFVGLFFSKIWWYHSSGFIFLLLLLRQSALLFKWLCSGRWPFGRHFASTNK